MNATQGGLRYRSPFHKHLQYLMLKFDKQKRKSSFRNAPCCACVRRCVNPTGSDSILDVNNSHDKQEVRAQQCDRTGSDSQWDEAGLTVWHQYMKEEEEGGQEDDQMIHWPDCLTDSLFSNWQTSKCSCSTEPWNVEENQTKTDLISYIFQSNILSWFFYLEPKVYWRAVMMFSTLGAVSNLRSFVQLNQTLVCWFVFPLGTIRSGRSDHSVWTKITEQNRGSFVVGTWSDLDLTRLQSELCKSALNGSCNQVNFACWDVDEQNQQLRASSWRMNRGLTWTNNKVCSPLDIWAGVDWTLSSEKHFGLLEFFSLCERNRTKARPVYWLNLWFGKTNYRFENGAFTPNLFG